MDAFSYRTWMEEEKTENAIFGIWYKPKWIFIGSMDIVVVHGMVVNHIKDFCNCTVLDVRWFLNKIIRIQQQFQTIRYRFSALISYFSCFILHSIGAESQIQLHALLHSMSSEHGSEFKSFSFLLYFNP